MRPSTLDTVSRILRRLADELVVPRFRGLGAADVSEKGPGDPVTVVDREVEAGLVQELPPLIPGSRVVGEESASADPSTLHDIGKGWVWVVDPIDGTVNFVEGRDTFATMVGLLRDGEGVASWIFSPIRDRLTVAEVGAGVWSNGKRVRIADPPPGQEAADMASTTYLPSKLRERWRAAGLGARFLAGSGAAGVEYPDLVSGHWRTLFYSRTLPWDHVPGTLLVTEAGGHVARPDGSPYTAGDGKSGVLVAANEDDWARVRALLGDVYG